MILKADLIELLEGFPEEFPAEWLFAALESLRSPALSAKDHDAIEAAAIRVEAKGGTSLEDLKAAFLSAQSN